MMPLPLQRSQPLQNTGWKRFSSKAFKPSTRTNLSRIEWGQHELRWLYHPQLYMSELDALIKQGHTQLGQREFEAAIQTFSQMLEQAPDSISAYTGRATAQTMLGHFDMALQDLNCALALGREQPAFFDQRGQLFVRIGRQAEALEDFRRALELNPNADRCYRYGLTLSSLEHYGEALPYLEKAVELQPNYVEAITERGMVRMELGRFELAKEDFDQAVRIDPNYHIAWSHRAVYHHRRREWGEAVANASRAIELSPGYALPYKLRALAKKEQGQIEEAIADLEQFLALDSNDSERQHLEALLKKWKRTGGQKRSWFARWFKLDR
jgi:tetratricopeptide (TPR) repeat protein